MFMVLVLTSCWAGTYRGQGGVNGGSGSGDGQGYDPATIRVSVGSYSELPSKGSGAVDDYNDMVWRKDAVYVYGFQQDASSFEITSNESDFENVEAPVCIVDGSRKYDGYSKAGKKALVTDNAFLRWANPDARLKYPGGTPNGLTKYDFFAYYIDDYELDEASIRRTHESISFPVEIDGNRDYMTAKAMLTENLMYDLGYTMQERQKLRNYAYSSFTANYSVHPELYFKHHLCRIDFELYPGSSNCDSVYIQKIELRCRSKAEMTVVHKDTSRLGLTYPKDNEYKYFTLSGADGNEMPESTYMLKWKDEYSSMNLYSRPKVVLTENFLLAPEPEYAWKVLMKGKTGDGTFVEKEIDVLTTLRCNEGQFVAGRKYLVQLALYGMEDVRVNVTTSEWEKGGDVVLDGEDWGQ